MRARTLLLLGLALTGTAQATDPPAPSAPPAEVERGWKWPEDRLRTWHIEAAFALPEPLLLQADRDDEARVEQIELRLNTRCSANATDALGWSVLCELQEVALRGRPYREDRGDLVAVLQEMRGKLTGSWVSMRVRRDGRFDALELNGPLPRDQRQTLILETLRQVLERAFLGLELTLPPPGAVSWSEPGAGLMSYLPRAGSLGAGRLTHEASERDGLLHITSEGMSVSRASSLRAATTRSAPADLSLALAQLGEAEVDLSLGALVQRSWVVVGRTTPSTLLLDRIISGPYLQAGSIRLLSTGEEAPVGETGLWPAEDPGCEAWQALVAARPALEDRLGGPRLDFEP